MTLVEITIIVIITILLFVVLLVWWMQYRHFKDMRQQLIQLNQQLKCLKKGFETIELSKPEPFRIKECHSLHELLDKVAPLMNESELDVLDTQLASMQDAESWILQMEKAYADIWSDLFQGAEMPLTEEAMPAMRSLIMEVALHTMDFCRTHTGYVNLTSGMRVNPILILQQKDVKNVDAQPMNEDPFTTSREIRALYQLAKHDGVTLRNATIQGYSCEF